MGSYSSKWSEKFEGEMSDAAISEIFPADRYRVAPLRFPAGTRFPGAMRAGMCFVLEGSCIHRFGETSVELKEQEFASLPGGEYFFEVTGEREVWLVLVWELSTLRQLAQKLGEAKSS